MRFFKENSDSIIKLYINQIGIAIFAMFLYTASDENSRVLRTIISVFSLLFYFVLIYNVAWEIGAKDKIRIDAGRLDMDKKKGILLGVYANIPNFIVVGVAVLMMALFMTTGVKGFKSTFAILNLIFRIFMSMYLGLVQVLTGFKDTDSAYLIQTVIFLLFSVLSALITHLSYLLGLKDFTLFRSAKQKGNK